MLSVETICAQGATTAPTRAAIAPASVNAMIRWRRTFTPRNAARSGSIRTASRMRPRGPETNHSSRAVTVTHTNRMK